MRNLTFRIIMTLVVVFLSSAVLALSCDDAAKKLADQLKNNNGDNSGGTVDKGPVDPSLKITITAPATIAKKDASGNIKINAKTLADRMDNATGYVDSVIAITNLVTLFNDDKRALPLFEVQLMRNSSNVAEGGFVVGGHTNVFDKSVLAFKNTADSLSDADGTSSTTSHEVWRRSDTTGNFYQLISYNQFFANASANHNIIGKIICPTEKMNGVTSGATAQDNTKLPFTKATCYLIQTLSGNGTELNEAWMDPALATAKNDLRYMGVYTGDTGLKDLSDAAGWTKASFFDALNNTALQAIFNKNKYVDKAFYIELLKDVDFKK